MTSTTLDEIKLRRLSAQHLLAPTDPRTVVRDLCGLQAQFLSNGLHALKIRSNHIPDDLSSMGLVKNWTLRGTVHIFHTDDLPLFIRDAHFRSLDWSVPSWWNQRPGWALTPQRQEMLSVVILDALSDSPKTREELKTICRTHGMTAAEEASMFDPWGGGIRELCQRGFLNQLVSDTKIFCLAPEFTPMTEDAAELELARRYFTHFGPATVRDCAYFFGKPQSWVKSLLPKLPLEETVLNNRPHFFIPTGPFAPDGLPRCLFLAGFDQLMLGYEKKDSIFLPPEHLRHIFNLAGIVHPAILVDGVVVGRWKLKNDRLTATLFTDTNRNQLSETAHRLWPGLKAITFETLT